MASPDFSTFQAARPGAGERAPDARPLDLFTPLRSAGGLDNPYPIYSLLRTTHRVLPLPLPGAQEGPGAWLLTGYDEVHAVLKDPRFSADRLRAPIVRENLDRLPPVLRQGAEGLRTMLVTDPPDHTRLRKLVSKAFTPRHVTRLQPRIEAIVDACLDRMAESGRTDLIHDLAEPLPAIVIAELLGVPAGDHRQFREWSSALIAGVGAIDDPARGEAARVAGTKILGYLSEIIDERRRAPQDDLISAMIEAQEERDVLTANELLATSNLILLAGHETTTNLIGNGVLALLRAPRELARLRDDPTLLGSAVEELVRFDGPVQATVRVAIEDVEIRGRTIPEGAFVLLSIGGANHDPAVFAEPDRLDLGRSPNPHLGFGIGVHFCLGANMARLEARIAIGRLVDRFTKIELEDEAPAYRPNPVLRGLSALPLSVGA